MDGLRFRCCEEDGCCLAPFAGCSLLTCRDCQAHGISSYRDMAILDDAACVGEASADEVREERSLPKHCLSTADDD